MRTTYHPSARARGLALYPYVPATQLTTEVLRTALPGASICQARGASDDPYCLGVYMARGSHEAALDEIAEAIGRLGLTLAEVLIRQWVRRVAEGAVAGMIIGASGGTLTKQSPSVTAVATAVGLVAGGLAGSLIEEEVAQFQARRDLYSGIWRITPLALPQTIPLHFGYAWS